MLDLHSHFTTPIHIESIEVLRWRGVDFVQCRSADGAVGVASTNGRPYLWPVLEALVAPFFVGKDARDLASLVDGVYTYRSNYKMAGLAFWNCVSHVEFSVLDVLGKIARKPVSALLGPVLRTEIPVYLSSLRRDTTPEEEVAWLGPRLAETAAGAVKLKVGGRMSKNADAAPGRTDRLIPLARETFGDDVAIYVDANGSYDAAHAIEVGRMLEDHGVGFFEEPCPWEEYVETKRVADALALPVAGGEQDSSLSRFAWMVDNGVVDLVQPDLAYNGGFARCLRVANMAAAKGLQVTPHCPKADPNAAYMLHFAAVVPNLGPHQEFRGQRRKGRRGWWHAPAFEAQNGTVPVPDGPGLGVEYDPAIWGEAETVVSCGT